MNNNNYKTTFMLDYVCFGVSRNNWVGILAGIDDCIKNITSTYIIVQESLRKYT